MGKKTKTAKKITAKSKTAKPAAEVGIGTLRIKADNLRVYEKTTKFWRKSYREFPSASFVINLYRANGAFKSLIDKKDPMFLKGQISSKGVPGGARIKFLPDGKELDKAFSLFAPELTIHDERSNHHWNVIYRNPGGTFSYLYTLEKKRKFVTKKYQVVKEFEECYPKLERNTYKALEDESDHLAVPMYTLLKTCMRVGNETYYKINRHQGLRTLKKGDIIIKGNDVTFDYIAKDGVPTCIRSVFPSIYVKRLKKILRTVDDYGFVFTNGSTGGPIQDSQFKDAFKRYCGKEFYPHIVRSYYATIKAKEFLEKTKSPTKEDMKNLFFSIAGKLGHKCFARAEGVWKDSYSVTINHYINPDLVNKIKASVAMA
jgi:DNA topoisomerase IB